MPQNTATFSLLLVGWLRFFSDVLSGWVPQIFPWFSNLQSPPCLFSAFSSIDLAVPNFKAMSIRLHFNVFVMRKLKKKWVSVDSLTLSQKQIASAGPCLCHSMNHTPVQYHLITLHSLSPIYSDQA